MYFSLQVHTTFQHQNFKLSAADVFSTCSLQKALFATAARNFSTSEFEKGAPGPSVFGHFDFIICFSPQLRAIFSTSKRQKVFRAWGVFYIFTSKCAFRHSCLQFFDIKTSKSAPSMRCFVHFHFQMLFSPQRRAFFKQQNFKKCSEHVVFCAF